MKNTTQEEDKAFRTIFGKDASYYAEGEELNGVKASKILFSTMPPEEVAELLLFAFDWDSTDQEHHFWMVAHDHLQQGKFSDHWKNNCLPLFEAYLNLLNQRIPALEDML